MMITLLRVKRDIEVVNPNRVEGRYGVIYFFTIIFRVHEVNKGKSPFFHPIVAPSATIWNLYRKDVLYIRASAKDFISSVLEKSMTLIKWISPLGTMSPIPRYSGVFAL